MGQSRRAREIRECVFIVDTQSEAGPPMGSGLCREIQGGCNDREPYCAITLLTEYGERVLGSVFDLTTIL